MDKKTSRATIILGILGSVDPNCLSPSVRKLVAESLVTLLVEEKRASLRVNAIELVGLGFSIWEPCNTFLTLDINVNTVIRLLFGWFSQSQESSFSSPSNSARNALLEIWCINISAVLNIIVDNLASKNLLDRLTALKFLSLGLNRHQYSLYPFLGKLMEAVIRALDPSVPYMREALIHQATIVLYEFVKTFFLFNFKIQFHIFS